MLTINDLSVAYGKHKVLEHLNLTLEPAMIHGVVGLNGAGKTTMFKTICGFLKPQTGSIEWQGKPLSRKKISFLETQNYFYSNITGTEYLSLFKAGNPKFDVEVWRDLFKLPLDDLIDSYSTGMKKKLALIGVMKLDKDLLILDEPFNGVDLETSKILKLLLEKMKSKGKTIIVSSHILETLTNSCDKIHLLDNKQIRRTYLKQELDTIEQDIFKEMEEQAKTLIDQTL